MRLPTADDDKMRELLIESLKDERFNHFSIIWRSDKNGFKGDGAKLASYAPWRCSLFFRKNLIRRFRARARVWQQYYEETGVRMSELPSSKSDELMKPYKDPWYERALASPSIVDILIASVFILMYTNA